MGEFAVSIEHSEAKSVLASGGLCPPDPPTRGSLPLEAPPPGPHYRLALRGLAMAPLDCGPTAGGKLTNWPAVSKRLDSTDVSCMFYFFLSEPAVLAPESWRPPSTTVRPL